MRGEDPERYDEIRSLAQTFKGDEDFAAAAMRIVEVPELVRRSLTVEQIARAVARSLKLDLQSLRTPSRRADASRARALTAYLGKLYGRIPYARTAEFFNRSGASIARDVLALDQSLRDSKELQSRIDNLARSLTTT
jgi:chromosomal replication initiation ATPase DnaA